MPASINKILLGMLSILLFGFTLYGQSPQEIVSWVLLSKGESPQIDRLPSFPEGNPALNKYCLRHLQEAGRKTGLHSLRLTGYEAYVRFELSEKGEVGQARLVKSTPSLPEMEVSVLELVRQMPKWSPCQQGDQAIPIGIGLHLKYNPHALDLITD
jgi:hypothetical protein